MGYHGRFEQQKPPKSGGNREKAGKGMKILLIVLAALLVLQSV